jgi:hypothetical protein
MPQKYTLASWSAWTFCTWPIGEPDSSVVAIHDDRGRREERTDCQPFDNRLNLARSSPVRDFDRTVVLTEYYHAADQRLDRR